MKKVIALILVFSLALSLSGCSLQDLLGNLLKGAVSGIGSGQATEPPTLPAMDQVIDLSGAELVKTLYYDYYVLKNVTEDTARTYEQSLLNAGYTAHGTGWVNGSEEPHFMSCLLNSMAYNTVILCFYKDTLVVTSCAYNPPSGDVWLLAGAPAELIPESELSNPEDEILLDLSGATEQQIGEYTAKVVTDVSWDAVNNYGRWLLCRQGYEPSGYFENGTVEDYRYADGFYRAEGDQHLMTILMWEDGTALVFEMSANDMFDEYVVWNWLGAAVSPGMSYLENLLIHIKSNYVGSGNGFETSGYYYSYYSKATAEDFQSCLSTIISMGFTEEATTVDNGSYKEYTAARYDDFGGRKYAIWYQLILDGEYLEAEVGYSVQEGTHKDD